MARFLLWKWWEQAVIIFVLTPRAVVVRDAVALVGVVHHEAEGVVLARVGVAFLKLNLTVLAREAEGAGAKVGAGQVHAHPPVGARAGQAFVHVLGAGCAFPAWKKKYEHLYVLSQFSAIEKISGLQLIGPY